MSIVVKQEKQHPMALKGSVGLKQDEVVAAMGYYPNTG